MMNPVPWLQMTNMISYQGLVRTFPRLESFYDQVDHIGLDGDTLHSVYYKAALQASNDRINRIRRGVIIHDIVLGVNEDEILAHLRSAGL